MPLKVSPSPGAELPSLRSIPTPMAAVRRPDRYESRALAASPSRTNIRPNTEALRRPGVLAPERAIVRLDFPATAVIRAHAELEARLPRSWIRVATAQHAAALEGNLAAFFNALERAFFGEDAALQPLRYGDWRRALLTQFDEAGFDDMMQRLTPEACDRLRRGLASPRELFAEVCDSIGRWSSSKTPSPFRVIAHYVARAGDLPWLGEALQTRTVDERRALFRAELTPETVARWVSHAKETHVDVVVIGAGMAGLTAAQALQSRGLRTVVIEAQGHVGGRAYTDSTTFSVPLDLGCAWIHHSEMNPLTQVAADLGLRTVLDDEPYQIFGAPDSPLTAGSIMHDRREKFEARFGRLDDTHRFQQEASRDVYDRLALMSLAQLEMGVDASALSMGDWNTIMPEGLKDQLLAEGLGTLVSALRFGVPVHLGTAVTGVARDADTVSVRTSRGVYQARAAVVTVSTGVLASDTIAFEPPLSPTRTQAIRALPMANYEKVIIEFNDAKALLELPNNTHIRVYEEMPQAIDFLIKPFGAQIAIAFLGGSFAVDHQHREQQASIATALAELKKICGDGIAEFVKTTRVTRWLQNPWMRGSYSAALPGHSAVREVLRRPSRGNLFFAGEACGGVWATHLTGAHLSGLESAQRVARSIVSRATG